MGQARDKGQGGQKQFHTFSFGERPFYDNCLDSMPKMIRAGILEAILQWTVNELDTDM
jgi:hypothetical protein